MIAKLHIKMPQGKKNQCKYNNFCSVFIIFFKRRKRKFPLKVLFWTNSLFWNHHWLYGKKFIFWGRLRFHGSCCPHYPPLLHSWECHPTNKTIFYVATRQPSARSNIGNIAINSSSIVTQVLLIVLAMSFTARGPFQNQALRLVAMSL